MINIDTHFFLEARHVDFMTTIKERSWFANTTNHDAFQTVSYLLWPNSERHQIAFMFNFEVINLEEDCKEVEQKLQEVFFKLDHVHLTLILLSHLFWNFQSTFKLQLMILAVITMLWAFLNCFLLFLAIFFQLRS